jgi:hypothetical protein
MATSGIYTITVSALTFFTRVLQLLEKVGIGQTPEPEDLEIIKDATNFWLIQTNAAKNTFKTGFMPWKNATANLTLDITKAEYSLKPAGGDLNIEVPYEISSITYKYSSNAELPLVTMTDGEYSALYDKTIQGVPQRYYYERHLDEGLLFLDYVPSAADTLVITYKNLLELITAYTDDFDIDPIWYRALLYNIAIDVAPFFGVPQAKLNQLITIAGAAMVAMNAAFPNNEPIQMRPAGRATNTANINRRQ